MNIIGTNTSQTQIELIFYLKGVAGVSYGVNLIIGKVLDFTNSGTYEDFVACMLDAANLGADIVSLSLGVRKSTEISRTCQFDTSVVLSDATPVRKAKISITAI